MKKKSSFIKRYFRFLAAGSLVLIFQSCSNQNLPQVCIQKKSAEQVCLTVEVARTQNQRQLGLMYRKALPETSGMLFIFDDDSSRAFTMKNTLVPLDMIFIDREKRIVGWLENTKPQTEGPYEFEKATRYVLEANAFFCNKNGLSAGDKVEFTNINDL